MRGFVCRLCGGDTHVIESRPKRMRVLRRRECLKCRNRYSTVEVLADDVDLFDAMNKLLDKRAARSGAAKKGTET